jgi:two-component system sensor histidine kinase KdpD
MADLPGIEEGLRAVARHAVPRHEPPGVVVLPIRLGGSPIGSLALMGATLSDTVLQSVVNLAGIGLERANAQEASTRAEAARQSSELRAAVLDAVAHEFKTPLTSIKAAVGGLRSTAPSGTADGELVTIISEESNRLQALVDAAVQMLRIDAGDFVLHRDRHVLADLVAGTIKESGLQFEGHTLVNHVPGDVTIEVDGRLLRLALRQLLDNAVKYSPPTSTIEIGATGNAIVELTVRNSGPAIPEHEQRRIFERFYRGTQARHVPGTGMGLAIVQRIAQAHGGTLTVSSADGAGTEFRLSLPKANGEGAGRPAFESRPGGPATQQQERTS